MSTIRGRQAEEVAAEFLRGHGCTVLAQNWRTRWCEIDIVAQKGKHLFFVEVKYRASTAWGSGLEYITPKKVRQMRFAAEFWLAAYDGKGSYSLAAAELTDNPPRMSGWARDIL